MLPSLWSISYQAQFHISGRDRMSHDTCFETLMPTRQVQNAFRTRESGMLTDTHDIPISVSLYIHTHLQNVGFPMTWLIHLLIVDMKRKKWVNE